MRFGLAFLALFLAAAAAQAASRSLDDCEAIQAPHAYNECLASFGPMRGVRGGKYTAPAGKGGPGARRQGRGGAVSGSVVRRGPGGRIRMEFTPGRR
jgi:hypothetical protein